MSLPIIFAWLRGNWRLVAEGAVVLVLILAVRACDRTVDRTIETATERGVVQERAAANNEVIANAEKIAQADAAIRGGDPVERMRDDPHCRDCSND